MQHDVKGKDKVTNNVIKRKMQKKWVKKNPSIEVNTLALEAASINSSKN